MWSIELWGHMCFVHVSECNISLWRKERIHSTVCIVNVKTTAKTCLGVFVHCMNKLMYESVSPYVCALLYCVCVHVVGRADKQAVGWEVEGVHRLRLLTQSWQNAAPGAPRNLAGRAQRCNLIPAIQHAAPKNAHRGIGCKGHSSIYTYTSPCVFFFPLRNNQL